MGSARHSGPRDSRGCPRYRRAACRGRMRLHLKCALGRPGRRDLSARAGERRHDLDLIGGGAADATSVDGAHLNREEFMSVIRDVMPAFDLVQPRSVSDAQHVLQQYGADAWIMAGGLDSFDWLKDR